MPGRAIYHIVHEPPMFAGRSGMLPLTEAVNATAVRYSVHWRKWAGRSWLAGYLCRRFGMLYYGSIYNDLFPLIEERSLARRIHAESNGVVHFMWSDFASPSVQRWFRTRHSLLVGTYHSSISRLARVCSRRRLLQQYDGIVLMSESQVPFFLEAGVPAERLKVILHGVDLGFFKPEESRRATGNEPLRLLLTGATQRDHVFAAEVMRYMKNCACHLYVRTAQEQEVHYRALPNVTLLPFQSDDALLKLYQQADLLMMPMIDCTANNAILEAMACGTPVLVNRVGGIPEYVDPSCNYIMHNTCVKTWADQLRSLIQHREQLVERRQAVRAWAKKFSWKRAGEELLDFYDELRAVL